MGLFRRTAELVSANLHDFVERFEQPERMFRHSLRDMETLVERTTAAVARSIAAERLLAKTHRTEQDEIARWTQRAAAAVAAGDDPLGRRAIERRFEHERTLALLARQLAEAAETNAALRRQLEILRRNMPPPKPRARPDRSSDRGRRPPARGPHRPNLRSACWPGWSAGVGRSTPPKPKRSCSPSWKPPPTCLWSKNSTAAQPPPRSKPNWPG